MKHLKTYHLFESVDNIKSDLEDIFLDVSDQSTWFVSVDGDNISKFYEVYISFGDTEPYNNQEDDEFGYEQKEIPTELIDCVKRSIDVMNNNGYSHKLLFCSEYSSDSSEDILSSIEIEDLYNNMIMSENESIRIRFRK